MEGHWLARSCVVLSKQSFQEPLWVKEGFRCFRQASDRARRIEALTLGKSSPAQKIQAWRTESRKHQEQSSPKACLCYCLHQIDHSLKDKQTVVILINKIMNGHNNGTSGYTCKDCVNQKSGSLTNLNNYV